MLNASSANPSYVTTFAGVRNKDHTDLAAVVIITSVLIETVRTSETITEGVTIARSPTTVNLEPPPPQTPHPEVVPQQNSQTSTKTKIETTQTTVESLTSQSSTFSEILTTSTTSTTSSSSSLQVHEPFHTSEVSVFSSNTDIHTSVGGSTLVSPSSLETSSSTWPSASIMSTSSTFQKMTPVVTFSSHSPTASPSTTLGSAFAESSTSTNESTGDRINHRRVGAIVGGTLGAAAFIALGILALYFFRRRRWTNPHKRQNSRQGLLPDRDSPNSFISHTRKISQPYFPDKDGAACIPSAPVFPPQRNYSPPNRSDPAFGAATQYPYLEKVYLPGESNYVYTEDANEDLEHSPVSPIIEIYPPSRSVSNYSQESGGPGFLDYHNESFPSSRHASSYRAGESSLTLPDTCSQASKCLDTPKARDSIRSDPFDLEPPANVLRKGPPLPSQSHWRFGL